jgi:hypothetical protein
MTISLPTRSPLCVLSSLAMVFMALSVSLLIGYLSLGRGDPTDLIITLAIALFAAGFSIVIFKRVQA